MSHAATNWAIQQRGLKPAAKVVLWHLCDRFHPDNGCFPSQDTLARDCEMSRSAINRNLEALEEAGLICRERRHDSATNKRISTRYRLAFEHDFPCVESGHGTMSQNEAKPCVKNNESHVSIQDTNPVREPVSKPVRERERAGADDSGLEKEPDRRKRIEREFKRTFAKWPTYVSDSIDQARKEWFALSDDERQRAADRMPDYIDADKANGRGKHCAFAVYLREKKFDRLPDRPTEQPQTHETAKPYGKLWGAYRLCELFKEPSKTMPIPTDFIKSRIDAGGEEGKRFKRQHIARYGWPVVNRMHEMAQRKSGYQVTVDIERLAERFQQCRTDSPLATAWKAEHERRAWPWFGECLPEWIWLPVPNEPDAHEGEAAFVKAAIEDFKAALADMGGCEEMNEEDNAA